MQLSGWLHLNVNRRDADWSFPLPAVSYWLGNDSTAGTCGEYCGCALSWRLLNTAVMAVIDSGIQLCHGVLVMICYSFVLYGDSTGLSLHLAQAII